MEIVIDFDGTVVTHEYPEIGYDIGSIPVLKELVKQGHKLILFTMRSGSFLDSAVNWFKENNIDLYGVQYNPTQHKWTDSNKAYGQLYIDDAALGCPLKIDINLSKRAFVDWESVRNILVLTEIIDDQIWEQHMQ